MLTTADTKFYHPKAIQDHDVNIIGEWIIVRNVPTINNKPVLEHVILHTCRGGSNAGYYNPVAYRFNAPSEMNACYYCDKPVPDEIKMIGILLTAVP